MIFHTLKKDWKVIAGAVDVCESHSGATPEFQVVQVALLSLWFPWSADAVWRKARPDPKTVWEKWELRAVAQEICIFWWQYLHIHIQIYIYIYMVHCTLYEVCIYILHILYIIIIIMVCLNSRWESRQTIGSCHNISCYINMYHIQVMYSVVVTTLLFRIPATIIYILFLLSWLFCVIKYLIDLYIYVVHNMCA